MTFLRKKVSQILPHKSLGFSVTESELTVGGGPLINRKAYSTNPGIFQLCFTMELETTLSCSIVSEIVYC